jgi:FKBP-type peptidyl-prolyl cis-trans isomerase FkpA
MRKLVVGLAFILLVGTGCSKKSECPEENTVAPAAEEQMIKDYLTANNITATRYKTNLYYQVLTAGSGGSPNACSTVSVAYTGKLTDGHIFDSSPNSAFNLQGLIKAWIQGIPLVQKGGSIRLFVPPSLGYGNQSITDNTGRVIPGGTLMIFDISLFDFQ